MALSTLGIRHAHRSTQSPDEFGFRSDIQGLRTIAVGLVLIYHAGASFLPGGFVGVDVFFVISGFLITGLLLKELRKNERISLAGFYARRARRILPAAMLVLVVVGVLAITVFPETRREGIAGEIIGSAFNVVNWVFAASSTDYLRNDDAASPLQHFWTLAVEEQFYIVWPLMLVAAAFFARGRRFGHRGQPGRMNQATMRRLVVIAVLTISVPSLLFSIYYTGANPGAAYFVTTTRLWELGVGAIVAVFASQLAAIRHAVAVAIGWAGAAAIIVAGIVISSAIPFPGYAALLPTLGAAAVIVAGMGGRSRDGIGALLSTGPMVWVGGISYSLYLWHWPLIVLATYLFGGLNLALGLLVVAISFAPAYLSYRYVERPAMKWEVTRENSKALGMGFIAMGLTAFLGMQIVLTPPRVEPTANPLTGWSLDSQVEAVALTGAELLAENPAVGDPNFAVTSFVPSAAEAADDNPAPYRDGCHQSETEDAPESCVYGPSDSDYSVALVGDSHALQWVPALTRLAVEDSWELKTYTKSACPLIASKIIVAGTQRQYDSCSVWNDSIQMHLTGADRPDLVVVSSALYRTADRSPLAQGLADAWQMLRSAGVPVVVIADSPVPGESVPECVAVNADALANCAFERSTGMSNAWPQQQEAAAAVGDIPTIDLTDSICPQTQCAAVIGNVLVYRDANHLSATYAKTLAPSLRPHLAKQGVPVRPAPTASAPPKVNNG